MIQDLKQLKSRIQNLEDEIAQVITPARVREFFPNDPMRFGGDPLEKTFELEEIQAIDKALHGRDADTEMKILSKGDRLLLAKNISQELLAKQKRGEDLTDEERNLYWRVNTLGDLHDDCRKESRVRKERDG